MNDTDRPYPLGLWLIGAFKFVCGLLLVGLGIGLFRLMKADPGEAFEHFVAVLKLDPDNQYIHRAIEIVSGINPRQIKFISIGTLLYAAMYLIEGTGLLLRKTWGEYFTVLATGFFIPLEVYEVIHKITWLRVGLLTINVAIVIYLIDQVVKRRRREASARQVEPAPSPVQEPLT